MESAASIRAVSKPQTRRPANFENCENSEKRRPHWAALDGCRVFWWRLSGWMSGFQGNPTTVSIA